MQKTHFESLDAWKLTHDTVHHVTHCPPMTHILLVSHAHVYNGGGQWVHLRNNWLWITCCSQQSSRSVGRHSKLPHCQVEQALGSRNTWPFSAFRSCHLSWISLLETDWLRQTVCPLSAQQDWNVSQYQFTHRLVVTQLFFWTLGSTDNCSFAVFKVCLVNSRFNVC